jgi:hypothetical protein
MPTVGCCRLLHLSDDHGDRGAVDQGDGVEVNGYTIEPGADLNGANLREAYLRGADLRGANLREANLDGAMADDATVWSDGFDPKAAAVIFE